MARGEDSKDTIISLLEAELEKANDQLTQSKKAATAEIYTLKTSLDQAENTIRSLEESVKKYQLDRKEVQRVKSSFGEVQSQRDKAKQEVTKLQELVEFYQKSAEVYNSWCQKQKVRS